MQWLCIGDQNRMAAPRGFRVALSSNISQRKGICCSNLAELKQKVVIKFASVTEDCDKIEILSEDGTEIDDDEYFESLPPQSLLVVRTSTDKSKSKFDPKSPQNIFDHILTLLRWSGGVDSVYQEVLQLMLYTENLEAAISFMAILQIIRRNKFNI